MDFPSRPQLKNGASRLPAGQKENFGYYKLTGEERKPLDGDVLFEDVKNADILLNAGSAEDTVQAVGELQKEVKIEEKSDVNRADVSTLNAADLLNDSDDEKKAEIREMDNIIDETRNLMTRKRKHEQTHHSRLLFDCPAENCPLSFGSFEELKEHVKRSHFDEEGSVCDACKKVFCSIDEAMEHFRKREKIGCCACGKWFAHRTSLMKHLRIHVGLEKYPCAFCGRRYTQKVLLEKHVITHTGQKSVPCCHYEQNGKIAEELRLDLSTSANATLNAAYLLGDTVEIKEEPIEERFQENSDGDDMVENEWDTKEEKEDAGNDGEHVSSDEDRKKGHGTQQEKKGPPSSSVDCLLFTCPVNNCTSSFYGFGELKDHMEIHQGKQDFFCYVCKKNFPSKEDVMEHIQERQKKECCGCGKKFLTTAILVRHLRSHTGERPFACKICGKRFVQMSNLNGHLPTHSGKRPFSCGYCKKRFTSKCNLKNHELTHNGVKNHACGYCEKRFTQKPNLKRHELTHSGEKPFECEDCGKRFNQKGHLNLHFRLHTGQKPFFVRSAIRSSPEANISRITCRGFITLR